MSVSLTEPIPVLPGMQIGFQFKDHGSLPWSDIECQEEEDKILFHLRENKVPEKMSLDFRPAPLLWDPCRLYSFSATIG